MPTFFPRLASGGLGAGQGIARSILLILDALIECIAVARDCRIRTRVARSLLDCGRGCRNRIPFKARALDDVRVHRTILALESRCGALTAWFLTRGGARARSWCSVVTIRRQNRALTVWVERPLR